MQFKSIVNLCLEVNGIKVKIEKYSVWTTDTDSGAAWFRLESWLYYLTTV